MYRRTLKALALAAMIGSVGLASGCEPATAAAEAGGPPPIGLKADLSESESEAEGEFTSESDAEASAASYRGTDLRGMVVAGPGDADQSPIEFAKVELYLYDAAKKIWKVGARTYSDQNGMYYFHSIKPGEYWIQVKDEKNYGPYDVVQIDYNQRQYQDLPLLLF